MPELMTTEDAELVLVQEVFTESVVTQESTLVSVTVPEVQVVEVGAEDVGVVIMQESNLVLVQEQLPSILEVVTQGPQGVKGDPGDVASMDLFFQVNNRFYEIAENETAKATARTNLGLATIDGGTFF